MSAENNIILIVNDDSIIEILKPKLILLREVDNIKTAKYSEALEKVNEIKPEIILIYCSEEKKECLELIKTLNSNPKTKNSSILLVLDKYNQDFLLNAYEENITDYLTINVDDAEILIRTIWGFKKNAVINTLTKQQSLLEKLDVLDKNSGFYTNKYCKKVFENEFSNLNNIEANGILMLISANEESKTKLNPNQLARAIKLSTRNSDVVVHGEGHKFYVFLEGTQLKGAFCVWEKIKRAVGEQYTITAGISSVEGNSFDGLSKDLAKALIEASNTGKDLVIVNEEEEIKPTSDWLDKINATQKNFKLFKQAFNKKLDKVISPVFFQMQKIYEEKLFEAQIEQYSNSTLSAFILQEGENKSELKITYPGFSKINIDIIHEGLDSPENRRISLDLTELSEQKLTEILEEFIAEFKNSKEQ